MSDLERILKVRRAREAAIRARMEALRDQVRSLTARIVDDRRDRSVNMQEWRAVSTRRAVLDRGQLDCVGEDLAEFSARDAKIQADIERKLAQIARLEQDIQGESDALRQNLVGQEKLRILIDENIELKRR
ncbi:hypothetical protein [Paraburkholderia sediminicola]|uniref:hypothetical protein n=1 Tax=Paraburkholderia sediminicola TaxID=458836 RepID=UPI0038BBECA7